MVMMVQRMVRMVMMTTMIMNGEDDNMLLIFDLICILVMLVMWGPSFTIKEQKTLQGNVPFRLHSPENDTGTQNMHLLARYLSNLDNHAFHHIQTTERFLQKMYVATP